MEEEKRDGYVDFVIRGMLCILDLAFPNEKLKDRAKSEKFLLRKRIMDYVHKIDFLNKEE
jgi:hypothetical protein